MHCLHSFFYLWFSFVHTNVCESHLVSAVLGLGGITAKTKSGVERLARREKCWLRLASYCLYYVSVQWEQSSVIGGDLEVIHRRARIFMVLLLVFLFLSVAAALPLVCLDDKPEWFRSCFVYEVFRLLWRCSASLVCVRQTGLGRFLPRRSKASPKQSRAALREDSSVRNTPSNKIKSCVASAVFVVRSRQHPSSWQGFETSPTKHPTRDDISHQGVNVVSSVSV